MKILEIELTKEEIIKLVCAAHFKETSYENVDISFFDEQLEAVGFKVEV